MATRTMGPTFRAATEDYDGATRRYEFRFKGVYFTPLFTCPGVWVVQDTIGRVMGRISQQADRSYLLFIRNESDNGWNMHQTATLDYALLCLYYPDEA